MAIRQLGKNKYQLIVDYYDDDGNRRKHTKTIFCKGKKEAKSLYDDFADSWEDALPSETTVSQLVQDYIDSREIKGVKANTLRGYKNSLKRFDKGIGKKSARDLTTYQIEKYVVKWIKDDKLSAKTVKNMVMLLSASYKKAIRSGLLRTNPCDSVELPKIKKPDIKTLTEEEINAFMTALQDADPDIKVMCELALFCGLRRGEILGLKESDIDMFTGTVRIQRTRYIVDGKMIIDTPKTERSRRTLACPAFILEDIRKLVIEHRKMSDCEFLIQYVGEPMKPDYASNRIIKFIDGIGLPHVTLHGLRHTFATMLNASGDFDLADISSALGHSNITTTMNIYVNVFDGATRSSRRISDSFEKKYGKNGAKNGAKNKKKA